MNDHLSTTLNHAKDRRLFFLQRSSPGFAFASAPTAFALFALDHLRLSLMPGHHIGFIALHLVGEDHGWLFFTVPPRSAVVICYASLSLRDNSWAICSFDKLSPMQYRHNTNTF